MPPLRILVGGSPGCGKTTLCKKLQERLHTRLSIVLPNALLGGVLSREVHNPKGFKVGYELYTLDESFCQTIASSDGPESGVMVSKYHVYIDAVECVALPALDSLLQAAGRPRVAIIDDIGNMTCKSESFCIRVRKLLESPDPQLHVLAAVGPGGASFITEVQQISGVTRAAIDPSSRDSVLESLTSRMFAAALQDSDDSSDSEGQGSVAGDADCIDFDQWGGDRRQLGVKRGLYRPEVAPSKDSGALAPKKLLEVAAAPVAPQPVPREPAVHSGEGRSSNGRTLSSKEGNKSSQSGLNVCHSTAHGMGIVEWLQTIDFFVLAAYGEALRTRFYIVREVLDTYAHKDILRPSQAVSDRFFEDFGVRKLGHKRLFEKWFRDQELVAAAH